MWSGSRHILLEVENFRFQENDISNENVCPNEELLEFSVASGTTPQHTYKDDIQMMSEIMFKQSLTSLGFTEIDFEKLDLEQYHGSSDSECDDADFEHEFDSEDEEFDFAEYLKPICRKMDRENANDLLRGCILAGHKDMPPNKNALLYL